MIKNINYQKRARIAQKRHQRRVLTDYYFIKTYKAAFKLEQELEEKREALWIKARLEREYFGYKK